MIRVGDIFIDVETRTISRNGYSKSWKKGKNGGKSCGFYLFHHLLLSGGVSWAQLLELLYGNDPNGGPLSFSYMHVRINQYQLLLDNLNLRLCNERRGTVRFYWLESK